jgi:DNA-binding CsgD family transcriptional regulator
VLADIFTTKAVPISLPLHDERALIAQAQAGDNDSAWALLVQYRGLLQKLARRVQQSVRSLTADQLDDLHADLVLAALEAVKSFDLDRFERLSQTLPGKLRDKALEMTTALVVPRGTLSLWFKVWRAADQDFNVAERLAPGMGMSADTFRAITHALEHVDSAWVSVPYSAGVPTPDDETHQLAHYALDVLSPAEREVVELAYGFRGDPKTDEEVGLIREASKRTVKEQRHSALDKMREALL